MNVSLHFRLDQEYAKYNGFVGGFPNFFEADTSAGKVFGTILVRSGAAEWRDVSASLLGNPPIDDVGARFRATHNYATSQGFAGGFPNFYHADNGAGIVFGTILLHSAILEWRDVPASLLGNPPIDDVGARFRGTQTYATSQGFVGGFPNFFHDGSLNVHGTLLIRPAAADWRDVTVGAPFIAITPSPRRFFISGRGFSPASVVKIEYSVHQRGGGGAFQSESVSVDFSGGFGTILGATTLDPSGPSDLLEVKATDTKFPELSASRSVAM